jgi:putative ABC transport system ATP-binding protein
METKMDAAASAPPVVVVSGADYAYQSDSGHKPVLREVSLTLKRGEFVILTGPSGAGKTTLLTLIGALRAMQKGSIRVLGAELAGLDAAGQRDIRRRIGFIFQEHNLFTALSPFETLWLTTELGPEKLSRGQALERAGQLLASLGLQDKLHVLPRELSTGQQQRVAIARALINAPPLILADEPTASLDHANSNLVIDLLRRRVADQGTTVLMVTHDSRIFEAADRVVQMVEGEIAVP